MTPSHAAAAVAPQPNTLDRPVHLTQEDMARVNACMLACVKAELPLIHDITHHIIASGGKRLRPMLTLLAAHACGIQTTRHIGLAAAVEFIHTATLLHDDVVDESHLRRGFATANDVFGNKASVLVGDFLLAHAFQMMVADGSLASLKILSDAAAIISRGEVQQLLTEREPETSEATYREIINAKTAALFAAACEVGAVAADASAAAQGALKAFGQEIGMAFQLVDDALDYCAEESALGKTVGDDFREGKVTLPVILAYRAASAPERTFWQRVIGEGEHSDDDLSHAQNLLRTHNAIAGTFSAAREHCERASAYLAALPASPAKAALEDIVRFCAARMF